MIRASRWIPFAVLVLSVMAALSCQRRPQTPAAESKARADSLADSIKTAAALLRGQQWFLAYCAMCHGDGGNGDGDMAAGIKTRANVTVARLNDPETMTRLTTDQIKQVITRGGEHTGRSNLMPAWGEKLDPSTIDDIAMYVSSLSGTTPAIPRSTLQHYLAAPPGVPADGRVLFVHHCTACHGPYGKGDGPFGERLWQTRQVRPRNLTDSTYIDTKTDQDLYAVISLGAGHFRKSAMMPSWAVTLTPAQIKSVVAYIREISHTRPRP
jgi:cbb3-type cytochrome c oxidase subunit III